jgi:hypothetical protein
VARTPCKGSSGPEQQSQAPRAQSDCRTTEDDEQLPYFGDPMGPVMDNHIRVGSINLNNTLQNAEGGESLFRAIQELDIKILCMQEVGCNWSNLPRKHAFQQRLDRTFGPRETKSCCRHNTHDMTGTTRQWGGTGLMCKGKTRHYAMGAGGDKTGLVLDILSSDE